MAIRMNGLVLFLLSCRMRVPFRRKGQATCRLPVTVWTFIRLFNTLFWSKRICISLFGLSFTDFSGKATNIGSSPTIIVVPLSPPNHHQMTPWHDTRRRSSIYSCKKVVETISKWLKICFNRDELHKYDSIWIFHCRWMAINDRFLIIANHLLV